MNVMTSLVMLVFAPSAPAGPIQFVDGDGVRVTLSFGRVSDRDKGVGVRIATKYDDKGGTYGFEWTDWYREEDPVKVVHLLPIKAAKTEGPLIIAEIHRQNWVEHRIYAVSSDGIRTVFGFSLRDPGAIEWKSNSGVLHEVVTYDRWANVPKALSVKERGLSRWMEVTRHRPQLGDWKVVSQAWRKYRFGTNLPLPAETLSRCKFIWR